MQSDLRSGTQPITLATQSCLRWLLIAAGATALAATLRAIPTPVPSRAQPIDPLQWLTIASWNIERLPKRP